MFRCEELNRCLGESCTLKGEGGKAGAEEEGGRGGRQLSTLTVHGRGEGGREGGGRYGATPKGKEKRKL